VVRDAVDVLDALLGPGAAVRRSEPQGEVDFELRPLIEALEDGIGDLDGLTIATGLDPPSLAALLGRLEIAGRVVVTPAGSYALCSGARRLP
jgi:hypothetical protein